MTATELNTSCVVNTENGDSFLQVDDITHDAIFTPQATLAGPRRRSTELNTSCVVDTVNGDSYNQVDDIEAPNGTHTVKNTVNGDSYLRVDD